MGMQFTITLTGDATFSDIDVDASDISIGDDALDPNGFSGSVSFDDVSVESATVTLSARVTIEDVEVDAQDLSDFDADEAINEALDYQPSDVSGAEFEVTSEPTGFSIVEARLGRENAIDVYADLARAGYEVI